MSAPVDVNDINSFVGIFGGRHADLYPGLFVGHPNNAVSRHHTASPGPAQYKVDIFNSDADRIGKPHRRKTDSISTQSTQSTRRSSIFDDLSSKTSVESNVFTAPSARPRLPPDMRAHMVASLPNGGTHRLCCEFAEYMSCNTSFDPEDTDDWIEHNIHHLGEQYPPKCLCWFCDEIVFHADTNGRDLRENFVQRMEHIRDHIRNDYYSIEEIRPDFYFLYHLRTHGLIADRVFRAALNRTESPAPQRNDIVPHDYIPNRQVRAAERSQQFIVSDPRNRERGSARRSQPRSSNWSSVHGSTSALSRR